MSADPMSGADPMSARRTCGATSKRTGKPCGQTPPPGALVCQWHGGSAPQVKKAVAERIADLVDPALTSLEGLLTADDERARLGAVKDVLDRAGYGPTVKIEVERELDRALDALGKALKPEEYARVLEALAAGDARPAAA